VHNTKWKNDFVVQEKHEYSTKAVRMAKRDLRFDSSLNKYCECLCRL